MIWYLWNSWFGHLIGVLHIKEEIFIFHSILYHFFREPVLTNYSFRACFMKNYAKVIKTTKILKRKIRKIILLLIKK